MLKQIDCLFVFCFFNVFTHFKFDACNKLQKSCDKFTTVLNHLSISQRTISFWELWKLIVKLCWWNSFLFLSVGQLQLLKSRGSPLGYVALPKMLGHRSGLLAGQSSMHPQTYTEYTLCRSHTTAIPCQLDRMTFGAPCWTLTSSFSFVSFKDKRRRHHGNQKPPPD